MEDNDDYILPDDNDYILYEENTASFHCLPEKSKARYLKELEKFRNWMNSRNVCIVTEEIVVAYFHGLIEKYAPPSLWSTYSMLRSTLFIFEKVDISKFKSLSPILKSKSKGYEPQKAKTFYRNDVEKFMKDAPDNEYLLMKIVVLFGVMGACRCDELVNLKTTDITDNGSFLIVKILKTKNYKCRSFVVADVEGTGFNGMQTYRKYAAVRPHGFGDGRFFLCYRSGKCSIQPIGINTLSKIPRLVANYLNLNDAHLYTGHCFRRTSPTFLTNTAPNIPTVEPHGDCRLPAVAESYVEESLIIKEETDIKQETNSTPIESVTIPFNEAKRQKLIIRDASQVNEAYASQEKELVSNKTVECDEYDLYGEQIAIKLRKMDEVTRAETQHRLNCVIYEAEMKLLAQNRNQLLSTPCSSGSSS